MNMSPLKVGQEFLVTIKRIGINGEGIGYYKKQAVFIPGTLVGEEVVATCTRVAGGYAEAELVRVKKNQDIVVNQLVRFMDNVVDVNYNI